MEARLFHVFSGISRLAALSVILVSNPVHSVLSLIVAFVSACGLMMLLQVEFMSLVFVVVYVGAIAVLFLFVVMMLNLGSVKDIWGRSRVASWMSVIVFVGVAEFLLRETGYRPSLVDLDGAQDVLHRAGMESFVVWNELLDPVTTLDTLGQVLYTNSFIYLLLAGFVLLVARIGAIVLTLKVRTFAIAKRQQVFQQLARDSDRAIMMVRGGKGSKSVS